MEFLLDQKLNRLSLTGMNAVVYSMSDYSSNYMKLLQPVLLWTHFEVQYI